jgi:Flp pilus assembly protein TadG
MSIPEARFSCAKRSVTPSSLSNQRGVAAIELGLVLSIFIVVFAGIINLGGLMWAQQIVTQSASEGARYILEVSERASTPTKTGCDVAKAEGSWLGVHCTATAPADCAWTSSDGSRLQCVTVTVTYDTSSWPILSMTQSVASGLGFGNWMPATLTGQAVVQIQGSS